MSNEISNNLAIILTDFFLVLGVALLILSLAVGIMLVLKPAVIINMNKQVNSTVSLRKSMRALEFPNFIDHVFYRHHRIIGALVSVVSVYMLYYFIKVFDVGVMTGFMASSSYTGVVEILANAMRLFLLMTSVATLVIGIFMFFRPSMLKGFESWSNRWISTRKAAKPLAVERDQVNQLVYKYPRIVGIFIITLSLYAVIGLFMIYI